MCPKTRFAVYCRDNWRCFYCGVETLKDVWHGHRKAPVIDHRIPISKNGPDEFWNFVTSCKLCNMQKHDKTVEQFRDWRKQRLIELINRIKLGKKDYQVCDGILSPIAETLLQQRLEDCVSNVSFKFEFYGEEIRKQALREQES
jgi:hypothetical protein